MVRWACPTDGFKLGYPCSRCEEYYDCRIAAVHSKDSETRTRAVRKETDNTPYQFRSKPNISGELWDSSQHRHQKTVTVFEPDKDGNLIETRQMRVAVKKDKKLYIPREVLRTCSLKKLIDKVEDGKATLISLDLETLREINGKSFLKILRKGGILEKIEKDIVWENTRGTEKVTKIFDACRVWSFYYYLEEVDEETLNKRLDELTDRYHLVDGQWK